jgi:L-lactate dehydrogenase
MSAARKVVIVGAGAVGSTFAFTLVRSGLASEIVLIDLDRNRAEGEAEDMNHGLFFVPPVNIHADGKTHHGVEPVRSSRDLDSGKLAATRR